MVARVAQQETPAVDDLLDTIYQSATAEDSWSVCQALLFGATGAIGAVFCDLGDPLNAVASDSLRVVNQAYRQRWWREDVFLAAALTAPARVGVVPDSAFDDRIDREQHPFFRFLRESGFGRFTAYLSPPVFGTRYYLSLVRSVEAGPFTPAEEEALRLLVPHATRALAIDGQLRTARARDAVLLSVFDKMGYGALVLGPNGRVLSANAMAAAMAGDGFLLQDGRFAESFTNSRGMVEGLVRMAGASEAGRSASALLLRPSGRKPIVAQAISFPSVTPWASTARADTTLLMLIDTEMPVSGGQLGTMQSFGLTSAEARVAAIVGAGFSPVEAAEQLGSAAGTVRTQLKNVFNKLDLKRQSELVRLMTKLDVLGG